MSKIRPKAWGIGLGRTGTTSLCDAFRMLGYKRVVHNPTFNDLLSANAAADNGCILYYKFLDFIPTGMPSFVIEGRATRKTTSSRLSPCPTCGREAPPSIALRYRRRRSPDGTAQLSRKAWLLNGANPSLRSTGCSFTAPRVPEPPTSRR